MGEKIGVVTGGGDCPGLNAVIRSVAKAAARRGWDTIGIIGGYDGLLPPGNFRNHDYRALDGLLVRGGSPTSFDRALCSIFGAQAVELIAADDYGKMVAFQGSQVGAVNISEAVGRLKTVRPEGNFARTARALGICLGD